MKLKHSHCEYMKKLFILVMFLICFLTINIWGNIYWVSNTGVATWTNAKSVTALTGTACCTFGTANTNAVAGDTIYFRTGTYLISSEGINPTNSGTTLHRILFKNYNNEIVTFTGSGVNCIAVDLQQGQDYISVDGFRCYNFYHHFHIGEQGTISSNYNEIKDCIFSGMYDSLTIDWRGSTIEGQSAYNWIHGCTIEHYGNFEGGDDQGVLLEIGYEDGDNDGCNNNVVENCIFGRGGHHCLGVSSIKNVIRNNYFQNNGWYKRAGSGDTLFGDWVIHMMGMPNNDQQILIENNRIAYAGFSGENSGGVYNQEAGISLLLSESYCILRYNEFIRNKLNAIYIDPHNEGKTANYNCIYNNTIWHNGWSTDTLVPCCWGHELTHGILLDETGGVVGTHIKNNLFFANKNMFGATWEIIETYDPEKGWGPPDNQDIVSNWVGATSGYPKFIDTTGVPNATNPKQYDLSLQSTSGARDDGICLDSASNSGNNSTVLTVNVPYYFQDGWANGAGGGAVVVADQIAIGTVGNTVQISSINYDTKTITLAAPKTWSNGASIWLYKNSSGQTVLYGSAPDIGAHEYNGGIPNKKCVTTIVR